MMKANKAVQTLVRHCSTIEIRLSKVYTQVLYKGSRVAALRPYNHHCQTVATADTTLTTGESAVQPRTTPREFEHSPISSQVTQ